MKPLIIVGAGGFAREVLWLLRNLNRTSQRIPDDLPQWHVLGFSSPNETGRIDGLPILGTDEWVFQELDQKQVRFVVAVGNPKIRQRLAEAYMENGFKAARLEHPGLLRGEDLQAGPGSVLCAGAVITTHVRLGNFTIVNLNATVGHDCIIGDYVTVHPGANISGNTKIGDGAEIGTGAVILPQVEVGAGAIVGAGAVVTKSIPAGETWVGVPARPFVRE